MTGNRLSVTFFSDYAARKKREESLSLEALAKLIRSTSAPEKARLPWLKLARFGNAQTEKSSLRHDRNIIACSGVEGDYDGEEMSFDEAIGILGKAGIEAIVYTSPSHTDEKPRWRVLCSFSCELPAAKRARMMGRLNGLFRGTLAAESWTLSQSYYYGSVNGNSAHRVVYVEGQPIDLCDELDETWLGKPDTVNRAVRGNCQYQSGPPDEASLIEAIISGTSYHEACTRLIGRWAQQRVPFLDAQKRLLGYFDDVLPAHRDARWQQRRADVPRIVRDIYGKEASRQDAAERDRAQREWTIAGEGVSPDDFYAYMPMHTYIFAPTREMWPAASVNARIPSVRNGAGDALKANLWLDQNNPVEQMTWFPGLPMIIANRLISEGGFIERNNVRCFNLYRPPNVPPGDPAGAGPWLDHVRRVFPNDAKHIIRWLAHRVQRPDEKINHALVLGGNQGIGKDTIVEPVKLAVGPWNFSETSPQQVMGRFNGFMKAVIVRINEVRDLGATDRFKFYDHMKAYTAAPPDVLRVDEKYMREHNILNCCGVIITTNHKTDGIYLPADDRRHYVAWSDLTKDDFPDTYWTNLYDWYNRGGAANVAAYLAELDLSDFKPKAPPLKTPAFWEIVDASRAPEDAELADVLDKLGNPTAVTLTEIQSAATASFADWIGDRKNRRIIPHRLEECGYVAVRNDAAKDGLWKVNKKRQAIYGKADLSQRDRRAAATALSDAGR
jgi:hypothetical protein